MQESSFIHAVSAAVSSSLEVQRAIEHIADLAIEIPGISNVQFTGLNVSAGDPSSPGIAAASADIAAHGRKFGEVRIRFDLRHAAVQSPVQLARFIGQQAGILLARTEAEEQGRRLREEIADLRDELQSRKVVQRARGILARDHGVSQSHAEAMLQTHSQRTGRPVRHVAEAIVTASRLANSVAGPVRRSA